MGSCFLSPNGSFPVITKGQLHNIPPLRPILKAFGFRCFFPLYSCFFQLFAHIWRCIYWGIEYSSGAWDCQTLHEYASRTQKVLIVIHCYWGSNFGMFSTPFHPLVPFSLSLSSLAPPARYSAAASVQHDELVPFFSSDPSGVVPTQTRALSNNWGGCKVGIISKMKFSMSWSPWHGSLKESSFNTIYQKKAAEKKHGIINHQNIPKQDEPHMLGPSPWDIHSPEHRSSSAARASGADSPVHKNHEVKRKLGTWNVDETGHRFAVPVL